MSSRFVILMNEWLGCWSLVILLTFIKHFDKKKKRNDDTYAKHDEQVSKFGQIAHFYIVYENSQSGRKSIE